jgi:hypothetical protein
MNSLKPFQVLPLVARSTGLLLGTNSAESVGKQALELYR